MDVVVFSPPVGREVRAGRIEDIRQHLARTFGLQVEELDQRSMTGEMGRGDSSRRYLTAVRLG
jgi:hypothetical protein